MPGSNSKVTASAIRKAQDALDKEPVHRLTAHWSNELRKAYDDNLVLTNVLKNTVKEPTMQPVIALIGNRQRAEKFLRAITRWSSQVDIILPQIRAISSYEQTQGHYIAGYVLLGGMPDEELAVIEQAVRERGMGEPVKKYDTPDEFRRAVYALRIVPSQVEGSIRIVPPPPGLLSPTGA